MTRMCAFPPLGKPVVTALTDRDYLVLNAGQLEPYEFPTLPAAWDKAREMAEEFPDNPPRIYARFPNNQYPGHGTIRMACWKENY